MASCTISDCLLSSPIPLFLPEASLSPMRVTLTHFALSSYERALCLPTSCPISGLARLVVKSRLCRSSWRAFASTHPLMLSPTSTREALFACPPSPSWNLPFSLWSPSFPLHAPALTPLTRQGAALAHLDSLPPYNSVLWTEVSVSSSFGKSGSGVLANCSLCGTEATLSF